MNLFSAIMIFFGGVGTLLIGMNLLSNNMQKLANTRLEAIFKKTSNNRVVSMGIGLGVTTVVQSSSLTTVLVVGLVNAGMITLFQATAIIMGANIGTTITAQIAALQSFDYMIIAMMLAFIGAFISMLSKRERVKTIGNVLSGLGLIFVALNLLTLAMKDFREHEVIYNTLASINNPFVLLLIGAVLTGIFQSSSAITSIIISMAIAGMPIGDGGNAPLFVVIGSNIGTCVTAMLSSIGTSTNAKRAALIHLMFNFFGSIIFAIFLLAWPSFTADVLAKGFPTKPGTQIAMFHTLFNVVCVVLFLPLAQVFVRISKFIIRDKIDPDRKVIRLEERFLKTPRIALDHLQKEIAIMAHLATDVLEHAYQAFLKQEVSEKERIIEEIDYINNAIKQLTNYLVKITSNDLTKKEQDVSSNLYYVISDLGRVADLAHNFTKYTDSYVYEKLVFTDEAFSRLDLMFLRVKQLANEMIMIFNDDEEASIELVDKLEAEIDTLREQLIDEHIERLNCGKCQANSSPVWINLVSNLERAADHMAMASHLVIEGGNKQ